MNDDKLFSRLVSQRLRGSDLDQVNGLIGGGTDIYLAMFDFEVESHSALIRSVSPWTPGDADVTVSFAEKVLPDKRVSADDEVTVHYLRPFNP